MKMNIKWGRILTTGLLGAMLVSSLAIPSALAKTTNANANANGQAKSAGANANSNKQNSNGKSVKQQLLNAIGQSGNQQNAAADQGKNANLDKSANQGNQNGVRKPGNDKPLFDFNMKSVTVTIQYLDNGIKETFVSTDQSVIAQMKQVVTRLNKMNESKPAEAKINVVAEATSTGMVITTTSSDAQVAARIIGESQIRELERKLRDAGVDIKATITRTVTETETGVVITLSSTNADVAKLIKLREKFPMPEQRPDMKPGKGPQMPPGQVKKGLGVVPDAQGANPDAAQQDSIL
jgi:hypothetical protein